MLRNYFAKRKIRKFLTEIPRTLAHDYGKADQYTPGQVKTVVLKLGYDEEVARIGIAIYCNAEAAEAFGMSKALIKEYRGYPERHKVTIDQAAGAGSFDIGGGSD